MDRFRKKITFDKKEIDTNDFWLIKDNPMTKIGVFPYLGRQISPELEPDKIYQVLRPEEELTSPETLKSLELIPLVNEHTMLGTKDGMMPAEEKGVHGVTGQHPKVQKPLITNDLKVFSEELKNEIENGKKELSAGYSCRYDLTPGEYNGQHYDAIQRDVRFNHIALVGEGRMGKDVRVMDSIYTYDSITDIKNKEKQMPQEETKQAQDVDKRELIREVMAIAAKPDSDFEGGEEEKIETIAKKLEEMSYNPSEAGNNDEDDTEEKKDEGQDEDEEKKDEKATDADEDEKCGDEDPENDDKKDGEDEDEDKTEEEKPVSMDSAIKYFAKREQLINDLKPVIGTSNRFSSMKISEIQKYACDKLDIPNDMSYLQGYLKAQKKSSQVRVSMDSLFEAPAHSSFMQEYLK